MSKNNRYDTLVIGAGAAGTMAAIAAAGQGQNVILIEKNEKIGKKIYITGKGRCNVTNAVPTEEILKNIPTNSKFLYAAFHAMSSHQLMAFFEEAGCPLKIERGNRVFPVSDKSLDIILGLERMIKKNRVHLRKNQTVKQLLTEKIQAGEENGASSKKDAPAYRVIGVQLENGDKIWAKRVILATGGLAYPATGSTGDGYPMAQQVGHQVIELTPGLVPLNTQELDFAGSAPFLLKNVDFSLRYNGKEIFTDRGEVQFTRFGLSGALVLSASSYLPKQLNGKVDAEIDLKPALTSEQLDSRILREINANPTADTETILSTLLPKALIAPFLTRTGVFTRERAAEISRADRQKLVHTFKKISFQITGRRDFKEAIITRGGIDLKQINPKTMESKLAKGLYIVGELADIDALTGGYNLQVAFSTGYLAGIQPVEEE